MIDISLTVKVMASYTRRLPAPSRSFFLFGPRGTGKSTWLRAAFPRARWHDLLRDSELLRLMRSPGTLTGEVEALPKGSWVVLDEVQRLPALLNEVHDLIARFGARYRFALTGSSARKLKRGDVNLLAGRAINRQFFPLTMAELGALAQPGLDDVLRFGMLPAVRAERAAGARADLLQAYAENYVAQEVRLEAIVKNLDSFARFLEVAAIANGQVTNVASLARDAAVARPTVIGYFEVLVDTLLGTWLPAWRPRAKVKETAHPKFYFFDPGVARAVAGRARAPLDSAERGPLFETWVLHELRAHLSYTQSNATLSYWRTPSGSEVDFVCSGPKRTVGIEVKASAEWRRGAGDALKALLSAGTIHRAYGVYGGKVALEDGPVHVLPFQEFARTLAARKIL